MRTASLVLVVLVVLAACGHDDPDGANDAPPADGVDATGIDASVTPIDASVTPVDAQDAGSVLTPCVNGAEEVGHWGSGTNEQPMIAPPALAILPSGELIAAFNLEDASFIMATRAGDAWAFDSLTQHGSMPSLAIAPDGSAHICFIQADVGYAGVLVCFDRQPDRSWIGAIVGVRARAPSLAVDASGGLHVSFVRDDGVWIARRPPGASWTSELLAAAQTTGPTSLALDSNGMEHVLWPATRSDGYRELRLDGAPVPTGLGPYVSARALTIDGANVQHLVVIDANQLTHLSRSPGGGWQREGYLDGTGGITTSASSALDANGDLLVVYEFWTDSPAEPNVIFRRTRSAATNAWSAEQPVLQMAGDYFATPALALHGDDVHVVTDLNRPPGPPFWERAMFHIASCGAP